MENKIIHGDLNSKEGILILLAHHCGANVTDYSDLGLMKSIQEHLTGKQSTATNKYEAVSEIYDTIVNKGISPIAPDTKLIFDTNYATFTFNGIIDANEYICGTFYVDNTREGYYKAFTINTENGIEIAISISATNFNTQCAILEQISENKFKIK